MHDISEMSIDHLCAANLCLAVCRMTNHIAVGKVGDDQVNLLVDSIHYLLSDFLQAQLWNLLKRDAARRWNADILLARKGLVVAAIQEKGDVRKLFRLSHAHLPQARPADDFSESILNPGRGKGYWQVFELVVI